MDKVKEGIQPALKTRNDLPLAVSTSWHGRLRTFVRNLTESMNFILTAAHGLWRQGAADMADWHVRLLSLCKPFRQAYGGMVVQLHTFFPLALDGGQWPSLALGRFTPRKRPSWTPINQPTNRPGSLTNSMQRCSLSCLAIPCLLLILKALYCVYGSPQLVPILSPMNPQSYRISIRPILILYFQLYRDLPPAVFPSGIPAKIL